MAKHAKRRRKNESSDTVADAESPTPLITCLPFELVAEILLYSKSPIDILSLSWTCKHFHATLVQNPVAAFIWKRVRAQTTPPVPDPTKLGFSEPQLANFIYAGGECTVRFHCLSSLFLCSPFVLGMRQAHKQYVYIVFCQGSLLWGPGVSSETFVSQRPSLPGC